MEIDEGGKLVPTVYPTFRLLCSSFKQVLSVSSLCGKVNSEWFNGFHPDSITLSFVVRRIGEGQWHISVTPIECSAFMKVLDGETLEPIGEPIRVRESVDFGFLNDLPLAKPRTDLAPTAP